MFEFFFNLFRNNPRNIKFELENQIIEQQVIVDELIECRSTYDNEIRRHKNLKIQSENDVVIIQTRLENEKKISDFDPEVVAALEKRLNSERIELKEKIESLDKFLENYETFCDHLQTEKNKLDQLKSQVRSAVVLNKVVTSQLKSVDIQDNIEEFKEDTYLKEAKLKVRKDLDVESTIE